MVNIGLLGYKNVGKTSLFTLFKETKGVKVLTGQFGSSREGHTVTMDFIRFTNEGKMHSLFGTGGHEWRLTVYHRNYVLKNADNFICMFDLSVPSEPQLEFFKKLEILANPKGKLVIALNKYDLVKEESVFETFKQTIEESRFISTIKTVKILPTVAVPKNGYEKFNENAVKAVLLLCD
ncbi:MAG: GTPase domain-containing protein [Candidatus Wukongarchaeota archaeon]|nr:GTPase domain-containing protein [Candidatus Wukongarchaeota archaeon]